MGISLTSFAPTYAPAAAPPGDVRSVSKTSLSDQHTSADGLPNFECPERHEDLALQTSNFAALEACLNDTGGR